MPAHEVRLSDCLLHLLKQSTTFLLPFEGLKTALVEADDFASGTSSRSTKLIHGGVRYLQKAIMQLDIEQYRMVKEALHERASMLESAPHLAHPLPIMLPVYTYVCALMKHKLLMHVFFSRISLLSLDGGRFLITGSALRCMIW